MPDPPPTVFVVLIIVLLFLLRNKGIDDVGTVSYKTFLIKLFLLTTCDSRSLFHFSLSVSLECRDILSMSQK